MMMLSSVVVAQGKYGKRRVSQYDGVDGVEKWKAR